MAEKRIANLKELFALIAEDRKVNGGSWLRPGCQAMVAYRFGVWCDGLRKKRLALPLKLLYRGMHIFVRNFYGIEIYSSARFGRRLAIGHQNAIVVDHRAIIGDDCILRQGVTIGLTRWRGETGKPVSPQLGNRVSVGAGAVLIGDIKIGDDVQIGPNAVVMTDVPAGAMVVAPPARIIPKPNDL